MCSQNLLSAKEHAFRDRVNFFVLHDLINFNLAYLSSCCSLLKLGYRSLMRFGRVKQLSLSSEHVPSIKRISVEVHWRRGLWVCTLAHNSGPPSIFDFLTTLGLCRCQNCGQ